MDSHDHGAVWRFAGCELHEASHELFVHGTPVALERKPFELLRCLIRRAGEVVTRDELVDDVWSGRVVSDSVVSRTVMKVRKALDDGDQRIVATAHGYGYRLAVPVEAGDMPDAGDMPESTHRDATTHRPKLLAVAAAVALALVVALAWNRMGTATAPRLALLPVGVTENFEGDWVRLGLMGYLATELGRRFEVLPETRVLAGVGEDDHRAVERLRSAYGPLDVLETSLAAAGDSVQLRYTLHRSGHAPMEGHINARSALRAANALVQRLTQAFDSGMASVPAAPLASELYARGRAAMMAGDARGARDYLHAALREDPGMPWARYELALAQRQLGELESARVILETLTRQADGDPKLASGAHQALAILYWRGGELDRAEAEYRSALAIAERNGLAELVPGQLLSLGIVASSRGEYELARDQYLRALHLSRSRGDRDIQARVHNSLGVLAWKTGAVDRSHAEHTRALAIRRELANPRELAASLNNLATVALVRGEWRSARSLLEEAAVLREELGDGAGLATTKRNLAKLALLQSRHGRAETLVQESLSLALDHGYASAEAAAFALGGRIAARRGDLETARERFTAAAEAYRAIGQPFEAVGARLVAARLPDSDPGSALGLAREVLSDPEMPAHLRARATTLRASLVAPTNPDAAVRDWHDALAIADGLGHLELAMETALAYSEMLVAQGRIEQAEPLVGRLTDWPDYVPALQARARYWEARGDQRRAGELNERARRLAGDDPDA